MVVQVRHLWKSKLWFESLNSWIFWAVCKELYLLIQKIDVCFWMSEYYLQDSCHHCRKKVSEAQPKISSSTQSLARSMTEMEASRMQNVWSRISQMLKNLNNYQDIATNLLWRLIEIHMDKFIPFFMIYVSVNEVSLFFNISSRTRLLVHSEDPYSISDLWTGTSVSKKIPQVSFSRKLIRKFHKWSLAKTRN